jgi:DNA-binding SARP family transcriptional activator/tetratricopeptide (TPR) repeat protein
MDRRIEFGVLGPIEVRHDGHPVRLGGKKQRELLAVLLLHAGQPVRVDRVIDRVWGDGAPETAATAVHGHILALRKLLGRDTIVTTDHGYVLNVESDDIDAHRFERLIGEARQSDDLSARAALLREALSLWRGEPFADIDHEFFGESDIVRLRELRLAAVEESIEVDLTLGRHADVVSDLESLVTHHPLRERLWGQLMLALYRSGRQSDALHAYQRTRAILARELGIDPGSALQRLEQQILRQDVDLDVPLVTAMPSRSGSPRLTRERKFATALFVDVVESAALAEREDPELVQALLGEVLGGAADLVEKHGGFVASVMGDSVLAMFGIPAVHEDDPLRAVRTALGMQALVAARNQQLTDEGKAPLQLNIGIEAGEVVVELARTDRGRTITGDAVNTAARLQRDAEPGHIVVGPTAYALTRGVVAYVALPPLTLKGKAEPVPAWVAVRVAPSGDGSRVPLGLTSNLIGRADELAALIATFQRVVGKGRPALVTVLGSAGIGKSRLAAEVEQQLAGRAASWLKGRCLAYGNVSYSALAHALKVQYGVREGDDGEAVATKVGRVLETLFGEASLAPYVEALVGAGTEHNLSREELFAGWRRLLERMAAQRPLVLVFEDIHWADDGLLDFIDHLVDWGQGPILLLTMARLELLERRERWGGGKRNSSAIFLDPLTSRETELMLEGLLSMPVPDEITRTVFDRSEGNPLFCEEFIRMLIDHRVIRSVANGWEVVGALDDVVVPRSVQGLIAARLDALPDGEKQLVQTAAVVGRTFWLGAVCRLSGQTEDEARANVLNLRLKELVVAREPSTFAGEVELAFRHVLMRDVAYASLPKALRADKHVEVAKWAEERAGPRSDELAELLATHYVEALRCLDELGVSGGNRAGVEELVFRWATAAGARAHRLWAQREAIKWFGIALGLVPHVSVSQAQLAGLWESYGRAGEEVEPYARVARRFEAALALYSELGKAQDAGRVEARLAFIAHQSGDHARVLPAARRALRWLEPLGESADLARAVHVLGWHEFRNMQYDTAEIDVRRARDIAERIGHHVTQGQAMVSLAMVYQQTGRATEGLALFEDALEVARNAGDLSLLLRALTHICGALEEGGQSARAEAFAREGVELARRAGNVRNIAWTEQMLSDLLIDRGRFDEAGEAVKRALEAARVVGEELVIGYGLERVAYLHAIHGDAEAAEEALDEARPIVTANPDPWLHGWEPLVAGHVAQARGEPDQAATVLAEGARPMLDRIFGWGGRSLLVECVRSLARVGRSSDAIAFRDRLEALAAASPPAAAALAWAAGLLAPSAPDAHRMLSDAAKQLEGLGQIIDLGRCLTDLAEVEIRLGRDPSPSLTHARQILDASGAVLFIQEVEEVERLAIRGTLQS